MLVVPLEKDRIFTTDGEDLRVISYTNYKDGGPAVYARANGSKTNTLVYFFDIDTINGVKVEYQRGSKVFRALGKVERRYHLPQPDDKVLILSNKIAINDGKHRVEVKGLKLKAKNLGVNRGMFIKGDDGDYYRLLQILDIDRALGSSGFNREEFLSYYQDYTGAK